MSGAFRAGKKCGHNVYLGDMPIAAAFSPEWGGIIATALYEYFAAHPQLDPMAVIATPPWSAAELEPPKCPAKIWGRPCIKDLDHLDAHETEQGHVYQPPDMDRLNKKFEPIPTSWVCVSTRGDHQCERLAGHPPPHSFRRHDDTELLWSE